MQPGVGPRPPALGLALSSQPSLLGQPRPSLLPGAESWPVLGLWASRGTVSLLQTSSGRAWVLCGPQFLLCSPVPGSTFCLGVLPLRSRRVFAAFLFFRILGGGKRCLAPPLQEQGRLCGGSRGLVMG